MENNNLNLMNNAFLSADMGIELPALPADGLAIKLMSARGSKLADKQLMTSKAGEHYMAQLTTPAGATCFAMVPIDYPELKWNGNNCWVLLRPEPTTMSATDFHNMVES